jgi:uncharacterized membrane protein
MNRMARSMVAAALAAVVALGTAAPAAVAAPPAGKAAGKHDGAGKQDRADKTDRTAGPKAADKPGRAGKGGKKHESRDKASKGKNAGPRLQRKSLRAAARKMRRLDRLEDSTKVARLGDNAEAVRTNIGGDVARLRELKKVFREREGTVAEVRELRRIRPAVYHRIINQVRLVSGLLEQLSAAPAEEAPVEEVPVEEVPVEEAPVEEAPVEEAPVEEAPVEAPSSGVVDVAQLEELLEVLLGYDGSTRWSVLKEHQAVITTAKGALDDEAEEGEDAEDDEADEPENAEDDEPEEGEGEDAEGGDDSLAGLQV